MTYLMARFVSPHRGYRHTCRPYKPQRLGPYGDHLPEERELTAEFGPDLRTDDDLALALSTFRFRGLPKYENGEQIDPSYRVSVLDTEHAKLQNGWTDDEEAIVADVLRNHGPIGQMYIEVVPAAVEKPWNGYDSLDDVARIVELALGINADLAQVIAYEEQNEARGDVLEALRLAQSGDVDKIIVSA